MIYADLPAGAAAFVDASVFIHHFEPNPLFGAANTEFLERIENQEINGFTTTHIVSEVAHRLMTIEAMQTLGWKSAGIALRLRNHPTDVQTLKRFRQAVQEIPRFGVRILTIDPAWLDSSTWPSNSGSGEGSIAALSESSSKSPACSSSHVK
jgi:predicted nucleic acid-binding protein